MDYINVKYVILKILCNIKYKYFNNKVFYIIFLVMFGKIF